MKRTIERTRRGYEAPPGLVLPAIENDLTRRDFLVAGAAAMLLGGCGNGEGSEGTDSSGDARTIEHKFGTTEVPVEPRRVVVAHPSVIDAALALGVEPVGVSEETLNFLAERVPGGIESLGSYSEINLEATAALEPDLIVGLSEDFRETYDELSRIAPTVGVFFGDGTGNWQRTGREVADALGRLEEYERELSAYEERAAEIGRELGAPEDAPTATVMFAFDSGAFIRFELPGIFSGSVLYRDVGLAIPPGLREPAEAGEATLEISNEELSRGDADSLFIYTASEEDAAREESLEEVLENPLFERLRAARSNNVHAVGDHWFNGNLIAANLILDDLEEFLTEKG